jgi:hypothetical protein
MFYDIFHQIQKHSVGPVPYTVSVLIRQVRLREQTIKSGYLTTCQPSRKKSGTTVRISSGSVLKNPRVLGSSVYGSCSWQEYEQRPHTLKTLTYRRPARTEST